MSYNTIILLSVSVLAFLLSLICYVGLVLGAEIYRKGIEHGKNFTNSTKSEAVFPKMKKKISKNDAEIDRYNAILRNLEAFDGTSAGQEEIDG